MRDLAVGFLWHMHQPYYRDPVSETYLMPWVRLHSIRGYYDMITLLDDHPGIRCTFNLVPSLLVQIIDYTDNGIVDTDFYLSQKRPADLSSDEKKQILSRFFMCNQQTMITPFPRYSDLFEMRGTMKDPKDLETAVKKFSNQDILDLQVMFNLSWTGFTARKDEGIKDLIKKGRSYNESDKSYLLKIHIDIMKRLIPLYKKALDAGQIEITVSPFYHPIGPLLMNVGYAMRSLDTPLPNEVFLHPEDLKEQISRGISFHEDIFGTKPRGMWPSEGSVCPEMIDVLAQAGIEWTASDEDILFASTRKTRTGSRLYKPYRVTYGSSEVSMFFRDKPLSDNIGFVYAKNPPKQAAENFIHHLENIHKGSRSYNFKPFVSIVLDGENPWESYADSGEEFLRRLYGHLESKPGMTTSLFSNYLQENPPREKIANLYTGSWINHNFAIWIGHEEDRKAWEYLARTRNYVKSKGSKANRLAWEEIYIAEGSDWFWWYGDEFTSDNDEQFDRLFRLHLANCYKLHNESPPTELSESIITPHDIIPVKIPTGFIHPIIDGRVSHFYEWIKAGTYMAASSSTSMYQNRQLLTHIYFGFDIDHIYMRIDFADSTEDMTVQIEIISPEPIRVQIPLADRILIVYSMKNNVLEKIADMKSIALENVLELAMPFHMISATPLKRVRFFVSLQRRGLEVERHPANGLLSFIVPEQDFEKVMWYV
jgi:alpha-amylase/alpha-mannosidase (GH57 family)